MLFEDKWSKRWEATWHSVSFARKGLSQTGLKWLKRLGSRLGFFISGFMTADLSCSGKTPEDKDKLMIYEMGRAITPATLLSRRVGIGFRRQDEHGDRLMSSAFASSDKIGAKDAKQSSTERHTRNTGSLDVAGGRLWLTLSRDDPIYVTLSEKNLRKSLASSLFDEWSGRERSPLSPIRLLTRRNIFFWS